MSELVCTGVLALIESELQTCIQGSILPGLMDMADPKPDPMRVEIVNAFVSAGLLVEGLVLLLNSEGATKGGDLTDLVGSAVEAALLLAMTRVADSVKEKAT